MKRLKIVSLALLILGLKACIGLKMQEHRVYLGNFREYKYAFFESFSHLCPSNYPSENPVLNRIIDEKFSDSKALGQGKKHIWLRNPENLLLAFNTCKVIGLDKLITEAEYNHYVFRNSRDWNRKTLNDIVKEFLDSDTLSEGNDYYSLFWKRRRQEGNLKATYQILIEIDDWYHEKDRITENIKVQPVLKNLLEYDLKLLKADSIEINKETLAYFEYLKSAHLDYSAYKLLNHNSRVVFSQHLKDSLNRTIACDTVSREVWLNLDDNWEGWISSGLGYLDPFRYYGP